MRNLIINKSKIYYSNYLGEIEITDFEGNYTGERTIRYSKPLEIMGSLSGARGSSQVEMFGTEINYDKTILISKKLFEKTKINENSVFIIGKPIKKDVNGNPIYNYIVMKIAETINEVAIAIQKVAQK